jgi:hypothetical protein
LISTPPTTASIPSSSPESSSLENSLASIFRSERVGMSLSSALQRDSHVFGQQKRQEGA